MTDLPRTPKNAPECPQSSEPVTREDDLEETGFSIARILVFAMIGISLAIHWEPEPGRSPMFRFLAGDPALIGAGQIYRLVTTAFVHIDGLHLLFNLSWIWTLGRTVEAEIGPLRWIGFCAASALVASSAQWFETGSTGIGASGIVYALVGLVWVTRNRVPRFKHAVPFEIMVLVCAFIPIGYFLQYSDIFPIGNAAHLTGLLFGAVTGALAYPRPRTT
jgi:GlpG protein